MCGKEKRRKEKRREEKRRKEKRREEKRREEKRRKAKKRKARKEKRREGSSKSVFVWFGCYFNFLKVSSLFLDLSWEVSKQGEEEKVFRLGFSFFHRERERRGDLYIE